MRTSVICLLCRNTRQSTRSIMSRPPKSRIKYFFLTLNALPLGFAQGTHQQIGYRSHQDTLLNVPGPIDLGRTLPAHVAKQDDLLITGSRPLERIWWPIVILRSRTESRLAMMPLAKSTNRSCYLPACVKYASVHEDRVNQLSNGFESGRSLCS